MKFIRWPVISVLLLAVLIIFFMTGYLSNSSIRNDFEYYSTEALNTIVKVGSLNLNVFHSFIRVQDIIVIDPESKSRFAFRAESVDLQADVTRFFEKRIYIREARIHNGYLKLHQSWNGEFSFLTDRAVELADYEPTIVKINKILTWTADHINPVKLISPKFEEAEFLTNEFNKIPFLRNTTTQIVVRGFKLKLPKDYPDFLTEKLSIANANIDIYPHKTGKSIKIHNIWGKFFQLSSRPGKNPKPVTLVAKGFVGKGNKSWFNISSRIDTFAGKKNVLVDFAISNIFIPDLLPLFNAYTHYTKMLDISSGNLTARGRFHLENGKIIPSTIYLRVDNLSAQAVGERTGYTWLDSLSMSNSFFEAAIPLDNEKPYFHFETAFEKQNIRTTIQNFQLKFKPSDLDGDLFDKLQ